MARRRTDRDCRRGDHVYGPLLAVGGGIRRRACRVCSHISIDLRDAPRLARQARLFEGRRLAFFRLPVTAVGSERRRFGERPGRRSSAPRRSVA